MNTLQSTFNSLAKQNDNAGSLAVAEGNAPLSISQPIDTGADKLLRDYKNSWLTYPPLEVEYLMQTLNEHLNNCLDIRMKAQELEIKAFAETNDQLLQLRLTEAMQKQLKLIEENEPKLLGNTIGTKYHSNGAITGEQATYWKDLVKEQEQQLDYKLEDINARLKRLSENGSGNNYVLRFEFLQKMFEIDLIEAYCRIRAASIGLRAIYNINVPVPEITDTGYLDKLILWGRKATYEMEKKLFNYREVTVGFALNDSSTGAPATVAPVFDAPRIMTLDAFRLSRNGGSFTFNLPTNFFERLNLKLKNPCLRGLDVHVVANDAKQPLQFWRVYVKAPTKKITLDTGIQPYSYEPVVYIPMATYIGHTSELNTVPNQREVHNVNPVGEWTIRIEPKSIFANVDANNDHVDNILVRMRISYEKE